MNTLAKRVTSLRARLGLSQQQVANLAGLKQPDVSKIERGDMHKTTGMVGLARALRCNPFWLDDGLGDPYAAPGWPFDLFTQEDYELIPIEYRNRVENELAGEVQRAKRLGNGTTG